MELTLKIIGSFIVITLLVGCAYKSHTPNYHRSYQKCQVIDECALTLKSVIEGNWVNPFPTTKGFKASVRVTLKPDTTIENVEITQSSGNFEFDESAIKAVYDSKDFREIKGLKDSVRLKKFTIFNFFFIPDEA